MIKLGVIGTGWITRKFVEAALRTHKYQLYSIYSRQIQTAQKFSEGFNVECKKEDDLEAFYADEALDAVYIASPNSLHFEQAKKALLSGKHVIVEKPAFSTVEEMTEIIEIAERRHLFYFEAAKHIHEDSFDVLLKYIQGKTILGATLNFAKYSSKMPQLLAGDTPNIFNPKFSTGALADLGVYLLYFAIGLFGMPQGSRYFPTMLETGVDGLGSGVLFYEDFNVVLNVGKINHSYLMSEIYFSDGTLLLDQISSISEITFVDLKGNKKRINIKVDENSMLGEALGFAEVIAHQTPENIKRYVEWQELSRNVNQILVDMRHASGILFPADKNKKECD